MERLLYHMAAGGQMNAAVSSGKAVGGMGVLIAVLCILMAAFAAIAAMAFLRKRHRFKMFWGSLAVLFSAGAMLLCVAASQLGTLAAKPSGDPQETVTGFFDALIAGDYDSAYTYLSVYSDLGLAAQPEEQVARAMYDALRASYGYELYGSCSVDKLSARQQVQFTYLDLPSMESAVAGRTMEVISGYVEERPASELYDENNNYLPQVAQEAYSTAVSDILRGSKSYYATVGLQLELDYIDGDWYIVPSQALLSAIAGGVA